MTVHDNLAIHFRRTVTLKMCLGEEGLFQKSLSSIIATNIKHFNFPQNYSIEFEEIMKRKIQFLPSGGEGMYHQRTPHRSFPDTATGLHRFLSRTCYGTCYIAGGCSFTYLITFIAKLFIQRAKGR